MRVSVRFRFRVIWFGSGSVFRFRFFCLGLIIYFKFIFSVLKSILFTWNSSSPSLIITPMLISWRHRFRLFLIQIYKEGLMLKRLKQRVQQRESVFFFLALVLFDTKLFCFNYLISNFWGSVCLWERSFQESSWTLNF